MTLRRSQIVAVVVVVISFPLGCGPKEGTPATSPSAPSRPSASTNGFQEAALESGIDFHTRFLEGEQGENFKVNLYDHGSGLAVADYDGDGFDDVYFVNQLGPNALFRNRGDGTFENKTSEAGVAVGDRICVCATWADYDNDGDADLFITSTRGGNLLFQNDGGKFTDVTKKAGVGFIGHSQTGTFFDYDNDGLLDLLVVNTAEWTVDNLDSTGAYYPGKGNDLLGGVAASKPERHILYHNEGKGVFKDVTARAGVSGNGWGADVAVTDIDQDGYLDVLISRMFGAADLFHNRRNGTFEEVAAKVLGKTSWGGMGTRVFDYNGDGLLDIAMIDMHSDMWMGVDRAQRYVEIMRTGEQQHYKSQLGPNHVEGQPIPDHVVFGNSLFLNLGNGKYKDVCLDTGFETMWPWGCVAADFDNDGDEDVFMSAGMGYPFVFWPNYLLVNDGSGRFENKASALGIDPPPDGSTLAPIAGTPAAKSSRCAVTADFDHDGRLDLMVNNFNDRAYYYRNRFPQSSYLAVKLTGVKCNRDAVGAVVRIRVGKKVLVKQVEGVGGYLSQSSSVLTFPLPDESPVESLEIVWPGGGKQTVRNPKTKEILRIEQAP